MCLKRLMSLLICVSGGSGSGDGTFVLTIPSGRQKVWEYAFQGYTNITGVVFPNSLTTIEKYGFDGCNSIGLTSFPDSIESIGDYAFRNCTSLTLDSLPNHITNLATQAFIGCSSLDISEIPASVEQIGTYAFRDCTSITKIKVKNGTWGTSCFNGCTSLTAVWISASCTTIGAVNALNAPFANCPTNLVIYTDATKKLSGWGTYYNRCGTSGAATATVNFNVSEAQFDAL